jgi:type I restriction enzyme, S subunit
MIANLKPYPEYKSSGLPWLGSVPSHWEMRPASGAYTPTHERNLGMKEKTVLSHYGRIVIKPPEKLRGLVPESFETYQIVNPGDIVLRTTDLQNDHTSLRVGLVRDRGIITSAYLALKVKSDVRPEFGYQFLNVWDSSKAIYGYGSGLRQNLDFSHFKRMSVSVPSPSEQEAIVRFVTHANGRLERAIRAKRKVITLLEEQKQVTIQRTVTRGLDSTVPLKPSGIVSLGDIPQHWNILRARFIFRAVIRRDVLAHDQKLSVTQRHGVIPTDEMKENSTQARSYDRFQVCHQEDLVLNKYKAHLGVFWRAPQRGLITPNYTVFRATKELSTKYFEFLFHTRSYCDAFSMIVYGVTEGMSPLYTQNFYGLPVIFPPVDEQRQIVDQIAKLTERENTTISRLERQIELLREYRTRLVADVVTGKLDVREAAAGLSDEPTPEDVPIGSEDLIDEDELAEAEAAA